MPRNSFSSGSSRCRPSGCVSAKGVSPVKVTTSVDGQINPAVIAVTFSNGVFGLNNDTFVITDAGGNRVLGGVAFVSTFVAPKSRPAVIFGNGLQVGASIFLPGIHALQMSAIFIPGPNVQLVPTFTNNGVITAVPPTTFAGTLPGSTPAAGSLPSPNGFIGSVPLAPGLYNGVISGVVDAVGRKLPTYSFTFRSCFTPTLTGFRNDPAANSIRANFDVSVKLTSMTVTTPSSVTTTLVPVPALGVAATSFTAPYVNAATGTFTVHVAWTNADGTCPATGSFQFTQGS